MGRETERWPFVRARNYTKVDAAKPRTVKHIVIHAMQYPERVTAAEDIARDFAMTTDERSAHITVDNNSTVQCVPDRDVAWAAPGANADGIQVELAGYSGQTREQWLDEYGRQLLDRAADDVAQYCVKFDLPPVKLTDAELAADKPGICGHDQVTRVFKKSDHTDPGPNFPWDHFIKRVAELFAVRCATS